MPVQNKTDSKEKNANDNLFVFCSVGETKGRQRKSDVKGPLTLFLKLFMKNGGPGPGARTQ